MVLCYVSARQAALHQIKYQQMYITIYIYKITQKFLHWLGSYSKAAAVRQRTFIDLMRFGSSPMSPVDITAQRIVTADLIFHWRPPFQSYPWQGQSLSWAVLFLHVSEWTGNRSGIHPKFRTQHLQFFYSYKIRQMATSSIYVSCNNSFRCWVSDLSVWMPTAAPGHNYWELRVNFL